MRPPTLTELKAGAAAALQALRTSPRLNQAAAALRLHHRLLLALALAAGIASMVIHWA